MNYKEIRADVLLSIPSPCAHTHEIKTKEFTLLGIKDHPDFAKLVIDLDIKEGGKAPELRSVKFYLQQYRNCIMSYERAAILLREHFQSAYDPINVDITLEFNTRGGLSSTIQTSFWADEIKIAD